MPEEFYNTSAANDDEVAYSRIRQLSITSTIQQFAMQAPLVATEDVVDQVDNYNSGGEGGTPVGARDFQVGYNDEGSGGGVTVPLTSNPNRAMELLSEPPRAPMVPVVPATRPRSNAFSMNVATGRSRLAGDYRFEAVDPSHRMVNVVKRIAQHYSYPYMDNREDDQAFFGWLEERTYFEMAAILEAVDGKDYRREHITHFMRGVAYLSESQRKNYKVKVLQGKLRWQDALLDTGRMETNFSGMGFAIWVMSPPIGKRHVNKLYTNSHKYGSFHHSSFLAGDDVVAAGEWQVTAGVLTTISSKTGHYQCSLPQLQVALRVIQGWGVDVSGTTVRYYDAGVPKTMPAPEFLTTDTQYLSAAGRANFAGVTPQAPQPQLAGLQGIGGHRVANGGR